MQIIVISLKEEFFSKADALLGVYSDVTDFTNMLLVSLLHDSIFTTLFSSSSQFNECMFSRILTLDLRPYPLVDEDNGKETNKDPRTDRRQDLSSPGTMA